MEAKPALQPAELARSFSNEILHLIVMPTEACNFRCVYCYEDFKHGRMEPWVVEGVKRLVTRRAPGLRWLTLSWFGGEPLAALDVIEDVMRHVRSLAERHPVVRVASDMTTNGYLLGPPLFQRMLGLGIDHYQISIDGPPDWHDRRRMTAGGKGTFDRIWNNLLAIRDTGDAFTIQVRVHASRQNADILPDFLRTYADAFGADPRFALFLRGISRFGGRNDATLDVFDPEEGEQVVGRLRSFARSLGIRLAETPSEQHVCYAARGNSFLVRADGRLNKCTVALEHAANQVGRLREDGSIDVAVRLVGPWLRGLWSGSPRELKCPMRDLADGTDRVFPPPGSRIECAVPDGGSV